MQQRKSAGNIPRYRLEVMIDDVTTATGRTFPIFNGTWTNKITSCPEYSCFFCAIDGVISLCSDWWRILSSSWTRLV